MPMIIALSCFIVFIGIANLLTRFLKRIPLGQKNNHTSRYHRHAFN